MACWQPSPPMPIIPDTFTYDPMNPVPSYGGNVCCTGNAIAGGAFDQRKMEARADILVYTTEPLKEGIEVSGPMDATLYVSSDAKDTDFTVKVIDVYPDGKAYNLDETIQRARYREGYDKPPVWMEKDKVYKFSLQPMTTSNFFPAGHRLRIEVSSSNFPRFDRNLNTGGNNYDEASGVVAHNAIHHSQQYPSQHHRIRCEARLVTPNPHSSWVPTQFQHVISDRDLAGVAGIVHLVRSKIDHCARFGTFRFTLDSRL